MIILTVYVSMSWIPCIVGHGNIFLHPAILGKRHKILNAIVLKVDVVLCCSTVVILFHLHCLSFIHLRKIRKNIKNMSGGEQNKNIQWRSAKCCQTTVEESIL